MARTSKFIHIDPQILLEYQYSDRNSNEDVINTDDLGINLLLNPYTDEYYIYNDKEIYIDSINRTGNYENRTIIPIVENKSKFASLTDNNILHYLDYDNNFNDPIFYGAGSTLPIIGVRYDTIKLHLISNLDFDLIGDGFIFEVNVKDRAGKNHNLSSIIYLKRDNYEKPNPSPFIIAEKLYTKYIELKIPALDWLISSSNSMIDEISNIKFGNQSTINFSLKYITNSEIENGQFYFYPGEESIASISARDEYSDLVAVIEESSSGDYFELYGAYAGNIYEDFINDLNNQKNTDIAILHDIEVFEQIGTEFIKTSEQSLVQLDGYENPYRFRPIILNSHIAISYRINYTLRILNQIDNTQLIRKATYSSFNTKKYGRNFEKLNLGISPTINKIYNSLPEESQNITINNSTYLQQRAYNNEKVKETFTVEKEFVKSFYNSAHISASFNTVQNQISIDEEGNRIYSGKDIPLENETISNSDKVYKQGEGKITVTPFDNFIKIIFYDESQKDADGNPSLNLLDLTLAGDFYISFFNDNNEEVKIKNYTNVQNISPAQGEVIFKISQIDSKKILTFKDKNFYISAKLTSGNSFSEETMMYVGKWYSATERYDEDFTEIIEYLKIDNEKLNNELKIQLEASRNTIKDAEDRIIELKNERNILKDKISELNIDIEELLNSRIVQSEKDSVSDNMEINVIKSKLLDNRVKTVSTRSFEKLKGTNLKTIKFNL